MSLDQQAVVYASTKTQLPAKQVLNVLELLVKEECTVPFIARYRKEKTSGADEVQIRDIHEAYEEYIEREKRREYILQTIQKMEMLTPELEKKIKAAETINQLEDLYAPYKSKKKTKGTLAKEAGLEPLANIILETKENLDAIRAKHEKEFLNPEKKITSFDEALKGAGDILIEKFAHDSEIKEQLRQDYWKSATMNATKKPKAEEVKDFQKYKDYFEFSQKISDLKNPKASHRFLAMRRGMTQKVLKVDVTYEQEVAVGLIRKRHFPVEDLGMFDFLTQCAEKAFTNYIHSSLDLEVKSDLKKTSDLSAIDVFGVNLKNLLLQPYLGAKAVLGVDPGVRTGCKLAIVDDTGKFLVDTVIYPFPPQNKKAEGKKVLEQIFEQFKIQHVAIGNGTFGRETLEFIQENVEVVKSGKVKATMISEAGASIYSASDIARKEFPDKDPTVRGAISIARRFQDPLAELVKIDPKSIGVGQYQHDVNQAKLKKSLTGVVESCVNFVGVDLNTASAPLLSYISGIGPTVAGNVVKHREENGPFKSREELLKVGRFSQKVFEQAAGFLRIYEGDQPLDATFIHPERYRTLETWAKQHNKSISDLVKDSEIINSLEKDQDLKELIGEFTLKDIVNSLRAPSQDPRTEFKTTEFRKDIKDIKDLSPGEWYPGIVTNITQFGAFVDIGIKENGLVHVSQIADKFVENALEVLKVGEEVKVRVIEVDLTRKRISLSCRKEEAPGKVRAKSQKADGKRPQNNRPNRDNNRRSGRERSDAPLKNNAFAALKNFKVK